MKIPTHTNFFFLITISLLFLTCSEDTELTPPMQNDPIPKPTAKISGQATIKPGENADLTIALTGKAPWDVVYNDGSIISLNGITESAFNLTVSPDFTTDYTLVSVKDKNKDGTVSGSARVEVLLPFTSRGETYSTINQTTGKYMNQYYFEKYFTPKEMQEMFDWMEDDVGYSLFQRELLTADFNNDGYLDVFGWATQFNSQRYGADPGKYLYINDYKGDSEVSHFDSQIRFGGGTMQLGDIDNNGFLDVVFFHHNSKLNVFNEAENVGGDVLNPSMKNRLILFRANNEFEIKEFGPVMDCHDGTIGDIDKDGDIDVVTWPIPGESAEYIFPIVNENIGNADFAFMNLFSDQETVTTIWGNMMATAYELFDIDGDGNLDIIAGFNIGEDNQDCCDEIFHHTVFDPLIVWGDGSIQFKYSNSQFLKNNTLIDRTSVILGFAFSDFDNDSDIDIIISTTQDDNRGFYDEYTLLLFENKGNRVFEDVTSSKIKGNRDQKPNFPNFYYPMLIDKDNDGDFDIVPRGVASWGGFEYMANLYWEAGGGEYNRK